MRNHALWLTPILAIGGFLSYYAFFARYPMFRDHPWANLLILAAAIALSIFGLRQAWPRGGWRRLASVCGVLLSTGLTGMLLFYSYSLSYGLPSAELGAKLGERVPAVSLASTDGGTLDLGEAASSRLVLVFYRGFW
jgi:hypothetical protein